MSDLLRFCGVAVLGAFVSLLVKRAGGGQAAPVSVAALILLLSPLLSRYGQAVNTVGGLLDGTDFRDYGGLMLKALGIGLTVKIASDVCRELGEDSLAGGLELAGRLEILLLCLPLMEDILTMLKEVMG